MKEKSRMNFLGFYNLILAVGAFITGIMMLKSNYGVFEEYPTEWISKTPFKSWVLIGIIIVVIFGFGNIIASILSFRKAYIFSVIMGGMLLISLIAQVMLLGEWYLATFEFFILATIQLFLSVYSFNSHRKVSIKLS